jgi:hypothetical protein
MRFPREDVALQWERRLVGELVTNRKPLASGASFFVASTMSAGAGTLGNKRPY